VAHLFKILISFPFSSPILSQPPPQDMSAPDSSSEWALLAGC
jgi:hypothetical protein